MEGAVSVGTVGEQIRFASFLSHPVLFSSSYSGIQQPRFLTSGSFSISEDRQKPVFFLCEIIPAYISCSSIIPSVWRDSSSHDLAIDPGYIIRYYPSPLSLTVMTDSLQDSHDSRVSDSEKSHHSIELDAVSARVWLKLDLFLLPVIAMFYFLSFLVRCPLSFRFLRSLKATTGQNEHRKCTHCRPSARSPNDKQAV